MPAGMSICYPHSKCEKPVFFPFVRCFPVQATGYGGLCNGIIPAFHPHCFKLRRRINVPPVAHRIDNCLSGDCRFDSSRTGRHLSPYDFSFLLAEVSFCCARKTPKRSSSCDRFPIRPAILPSCRLASDISSRICSICRIFSVSACRRISAASVRAF